MATERERLLDDACLKLEDAVMDLTNGNATIHAERAARQAIDLMQKAEALPDDNERTS
jgi:hypothetical protein